MTKSHAMTETNIPFGGFYETKYADIIESAERREIEYNCEERQAEEGIAEELRLNESELFDIYYRHSDYSAGYAKIARDYAAEFARHCNEVFGFDLKMSYELMTSPREYNFETDRLFMALPLASVYLLFRKSRAEGHSTLSTKIENRFTSCDGFISHYSNRLGTWLSKPLSEWDHNEVGTLLLACLDIAKVDVEEIDWNIYYSMAENDYRYYELVPDWTKIDADMSELRAEKADELKKDDPDYIAPLERCPYTKGLFS